MTGETPMTYNTITKLRHLFITSNDKAVVRDGSVHTNDLPMTGYVVIPASYQQRRITITLC